jgi:predicted MPP superfamily phosphohydrolase
MVVFVEPPAFILLIEMFKIVFLSLGPLCWLLALYSFILRVSMPRWVKLSAASILFIGALKFWWFLIFCEKMFQPDLPVWIIWGLSVLYDFVLILGVVSILSLVCECLYFLIRRMKNTDCAEELSQGVSRRSFIKCGIASVSGGTAIRGVYDAMRLPDVKESNLEFDGLPKSFDGYRIVHLSDIHVSHASRRWRSEGIAKKVNALNPDLVVITGDFIDGRVDEILDDFKPLGLMRAKDGVFGCTGNHEYYSFYEDWRKEFFKCGIHMLENQSVVIERNGSKIVLGGINDPVSGISDASVAFQNTSKDAFRILLAHRPINLKYHASCGVDLQLSGHTHGGAILGMDYFVAKANENHVRGIYREHGLTLYVNSGTGQWAGFPTRLGIMPEISLLTLTAKRSAT